CTPSQEQDQPGAAHAAALLSQEALTHELPDHVDVGAPNQGKEMSDMLNVVCELLNRLEKLRELLSYKDNELFTLRTKILNYEDQLRAVSHSKKMREEGIKALIHADR